MFCLHFCFPLQLFCSTAVNETRKTQIHERKNSFLLHFVLSCTCLSYDHSTLRAKKSRKHVLNNRSLQWKKHFYLIKSEQIFFSSKIQRHMKSKQAKQMLLVELKVYRRALSCKGVIRLTLKLNSTWVEKEKHSVAQCAWFFHAFRLTRQGRKKNEKYEWIEVDSEKLQLTDERIALWKSIAFNSLTGGNSTQRFFESRSPFFLCLFASSELKGRRLNRWESQ